MLVLPTHEHRASFICSFSFFHQCHLICTVFSVQSFIFKFIPKHFFSFWCYCKWYFFLKFLFVIVHFWHGEMQLIFTYRVCILALLNLLTIMTVFWQSSGFSLYNIMLSAKIDNFTSFPFGCLLIFSCLIALARTSSTILFFFTFNLTLNFKI